MKNEIKKIKALLSKENKKRILSVFLAMLTIFSTFSCAISTWALNAGDSVNIDYKKLPNSSYDAIYYKDGSESKDHVSMFYQNSDFFYCIEFGETSDLSDTGKAVKPTSNSYYKSLSSTAQKGIELATTCGYGYKAKNETQKGSDYYNYFIATQAIIWEYQIGYRTKVSTESATTGLGSIKSGSKTISGTGTGSVYKSLVVKHSDVLSAYKEIIKRMATFSEKPSFSYSTATSAGDNKKLVNYQPSTGYTLTLTDTKNVLDNYTYVQTTSDNSKATNYSISISGNKMTIKFTGPSQNIRLAFTHRTSTTNDVVVGNVGQELAGVLTTDATQSFYKARTADIASFKLTKTVSDPVTTDTKFTFNVYNVNVLNPGRTVTLTIPKGQTSASVTVPNLYSNRSYRITETGYSSNYTSVSMSSKDSENGSQTSNTNNITIHLNEGETTAYVNCKNTLGKGKATIYKYDMNTNEPLEGVVFDIYNASTNQIVDGCKGLVTDENGNIEITLPYGTYYAIETKCLDKYVPNDVISKTKFNFTISSDAPSPLVTIGNQIQNNYFAQVIINKTSKDTGRSLDGAQFMAYTDKNCTTPYEPLCPKVEVGPGQFQYTSIPVQGSKALNIPVDDESELTLYFKEVKAPEGYVLDETVKSVTVKPSENYDIDSSSFTVKDEVTLPQKNDEEFYDYYTDEVENTEATYDYNDFTITVKGDDNNLLKSSGVSISYFDSEGHSHLIDTGFTNADGQITFKNLIAGKTYVINQTSTNIMYNTSSNVSYVATTEKGEATFTNKKKDVDGVLYLDTKEVNFEDKEIKFDLHKTDLTTAEGIAGAKITIYDKADYQRYLAEVEDANKIQDETERNNALTDITPATVLFTDISDENGDITVNKFKTGNFAFVEEAAPKGYGLNTTVFYFSIADNKDGTFTYTGDNTVKDKMNVVTLSKTDLTTAEAVPGATIQIYDSDGELYAKKVTDENGQIVLNKIPTGSYTFYETVAPDGYIVNQDIFVFDVDIYGNITGTTEITDAHTSLKISKADKDTGEVLKGVEFTLYDENDKKVKSAITDENGIAVFEYLNTETKYFFKETSFPSGYIQDDTLYEVSIEKDGSATGVVDIVNKKTSVTLYKYDSETNELIAGATIGIYDENDKLVYQGTTDEDGTLHIDYLPVGDYTYVEIEAPKGYTLDKTIHKFTIQPDGSVTGENKIIDDPIQVVITKYNEDKSKTLAGCTIGIFDAETNELVYQGVTDKSGQITYKYLEKGKKYAYKELKAPDNYEMNTEVFFFTVEEDGSIAKSLFITDKVITEAPKTGGIAMVVIFGLTALAAGGGFVFINKDKIFKKRKLKGNV